MYIADEKRYGKRRFGKRRKAQLPIKREERRGKYMCERKCKGCEYFDQVSNDA